MIDYSYISLEVLAIKLGLPQKFLHELAESKRIPSLKVGNRLRFNLQAVQEALDKIASVRGKDDR